MIKTTEMNLETLQKRLAKVKKGKNAGMTQDQVIEILGEPGFVFNAGRTSHLVYKTAITERNEFQVIINNADNTVCNDMGINPILDFSTVHLI